MDGLTPTDALAEMKRLSGLLDDAYRMARAKAYLQAAGAEFARTS